MTSTSASFPMYDLVEIRWAHDLLWRAVARGDRTPGRRRRSGGALARARPEELWAGPSLLLSQACGYPLVHAFAGRLRAVATPTYRAPGCSPGRYSSVILVRSSDEHVSQDLRDLRGRVCAVNDRASHSGMNALRSIIAPFGRPRFFSNVLVTGSHVASIEHVASGIADVCAVDAVTHALLAGIAPRRSPACASLTMTSSAPALPYVTRKDAPSELVAILREALSRPCTIRIPSSPARVRRCFSTTSSREAIRSTTRSAALRTRRRPRDIPSSLDAQQPSRGSACPSGASG